MLQSGGSTFTLGGRGRFCTLRGAFALLWDGACVRVFLGVVLLVGPSNGRVQSPRTIERAGDRSPGPPRFDPPPPTCVSVSRGRLGPRGRPLAPRPEPGEQHPHAAVLSSRPPTPSKAATRPRGRRRLTKAGRTTPDTTAHTACVCASFRGPAAAAGRAKAFRFWPLESKQGGGMVWCTCTLQKGGITMRAVAWQA